MPVLSVSPSASLLDEPVRIRVSELRPGERCTLEATMQWGSTWTSSATFQADARGSIDPVALAPSEGTYDVVSQMGLFWSMRRESITAPPRELNPLRVRVSARTEDWSDEVEVQRLRVGAHVTRVPVAGPFVGTLFLPEGDVQSQAVITLGGSEGGLSEDRAALLASRGFAAMALAYFGVDGLPAELKEIPLEYFNDAFEWFLAHPRIRSTGVGVVGASVGGQLALELATRFDAVGVCVSVNGSSISWGNRPSGDTAMRPAWTFGRAPVTFVDNAAALALEDAFEGGAKTGGRLQSTPLFESALDDEAIERAAIRLEDARGAIMMIAGDDDQVWPSRQFVELAERRLARTENNTIFESHVFPGAGHSIGLPYLPSTVTEGSYGSLLLPRGGTPGGSASASEQSWPLIMRFLREYL
ncbi:MAG TPA: acyl-CoA thioesterase/bile acid-CoA:amino acid N-acyltransferase family protein [Actinomycetota bacterium]|nr:acyl-CoA thioesterase/bile acid-CoA:amino acid N-acyltransferase family protein [Actinomycetota bacterium]